MTMRPGILDESVDDRQPNPVLAPGRLQRFLRADDVTQQEPPEQLNPGFAFLQSGLRQTPCSTCCLFLR